VLRSEDEQLFRDTLNAFHRGECWIKDQVCIDIDELPDFLPIARCLLDHAARMITAARQHEQAEACAVALSELQANYDALHEEYRKLRAWVEGLTDDHEAPETDTRGR
jgi:hypothetical protein